jgi:hypothetical protein
MKTGIERLDHDIKWTKKQLSDVIQRDLKSVSQKDITNLVWELLKDFSLDLIDPMKTESKTKRIELAKDITREFIVKKNISHIINKTTGVKYNPFQEKNER